MRTKVKVAGSLVLFFLLMPAFIRAQVKTGAEDVDAYFSLLMGKNIGVVANNASVVRNVNVVDFLLKEGFAVKRIFSPEHGFRSSADAGQAVHDTLDPATGIQIRSLYGAKKKPAPADLAGLDMVVFDIQDVGVRFYTYISTLAYVMEACAESKIPVIILDRPNPNGFYVDGPVLEKDYTSFVGLHPVPVVYGMTIGEYACMVNGEGWLKNKVRCNLRVIRLGNYTHDSLCSLPVKPSPNLPGINAVYLYPSLCFFEGTIISVGRGTVFPFEAIGHPGWNSQTFSFTPRGNSGGSLHPPYEGKECRGMDLRGYFPDHPEMRGKIILTWLIEAFNDFKADSAFFTPYFNKLAGNSTLQQQIKQGKSEKQIRESWRIGLDKFRKIRAKYLLYEGSR